MAPHQPPPSLGFSRQEHWSGLPFPSPMHESEKWKWKWKWSCVQLLVTPWTAAYKAPPSMGFSRQEYWSGVPLPSPEIHYIFWILTLIQCMIFKYFFLFCRFSFHFLDNALLYTKLQNVDEVQFIFFLFCCCSLDVVSKNPLSNPSWWWYTCMFFSKSFTVLTLIFRSWIHLC